MKHTTRIAIIGIFSLIASAAHAQKAGDWLANVGWAQVSPGAKLESISSTEPNANGALRGASVTSSDAETAQFGVTYMVTDNIGAELALGVPPKLNLDLTVPSGAHPNALSAKAMMPALFGSGPAVLMLHGGGPGAGRFSIDERNGVNSSHKH